MMHRLRHPLVILLLVYTAYAAGFIYNTSYEVYGKRYFLLFDDAMISMRYARNLADGNGLVWNPGGERVEGFTDPLWTLMMATTHLVPLPLNLRGLPILIIAYLILALNIVMVYRLTLTLSDGERTAALVAATFTAFYFPLNHWGYLGMEVSLMTLLVSISVLLAISTWKQNTTPSLLYIILAVSTFVRIDAAVWAAVILGFLWWVDGKQRRRHALVGGSVVIAAVALQLGLQLWYYGDMLPNTYYLKMTGYPMFWRIARGFVETMSKAGTLAGPIFIITGAALVKWDKRLHLLLGVYVSLLAYSMYVGGDAWEWWGETNRYVTAAVPMLFVLLGISFVILREKLRVFQLEPLAMRFLMPLLWVVLGFMLVLADKRGTWRLLGEAIFLKQPMQVVEHEKILKTAVTLDSLLTKDARVAVVWAGIIPYVLDRSMIDLLGKNDRRIARLPMHMPEKGPTVISFYPGHSKYDYAYSIGELKPDVIAGSWAEEEQAMGGQYEKLVIDGNLTYLKKDSKQILWSRVDVLRERLQ